jgi:hypothetical protein
MKNNRSEMPWSSHMLLGIIRVAVDEMRVVVYFEFCSVYLSFDLIVGGVACQHSGIKSREVGPLPAGEPTHLGMCMGSLLASS